MSSSAAQSPRRFSACSHMDSSQHLHCTQVCCWQATGVVHGRYGQLVAPASHHTAVGRILPGQVTGRAADAGSAHRSESCLRSQGRLVGSDIRLRAGVLSHWLRVRQPTMTAGVFQSRWCHEEVLCSRPAEVTEPHTCTGQLPIQCRCHNEPARPMT